MNEAVQQVEELLGLPEGMLMGRRFRWENKDFTVTGFRTEKNNRVLDATCDDKNFTAHLSKPLHPTSLAWTVRDKIQSDDVTLDLLQEWANSQSE